jgi:hypothetical protein
MHAVPTAPRPRTARIVTSLPFTLGVRIIVAGLFLHAARGNARSVVYVGFGVVVARGFVSTAGYRSNSSEKCCDFCFAQCTIPNAQIVQITEEVLWT